MSDPEISREKDDLIDASRRRFNRTRVLALAFAACCALYGWFWWDEPRGQLPEVLKTTEVLAFETSGSFREASLCGLYRLHPDTVAGLRSRGLAFLGTDTHPRKENASNSYAPWRRTPLELADRNMARLGHSPRTETIYALNAAGCGSAGAGGPMTQAARIEDVNRTLREPGSYFTLTANREGMIVVDPANGLAWLLYFG